MATQKLEVKKTEQKQEWLEVPFNVKALENEAADPNFFKFEGLASTFGNIDLVDDIVMPGAFTESLKNETPVILWQHRQGEPIGMPIELRETEKGLFVRAQLPRSDDLVKGRVIPQMEVGSIKSMSIGFIVEEFTIDENNIRKLEKIRLKEISLVTFPANPLADVTGMKQEPITKVDIDRVNEVKTKRDFEKLLRESGVFSNNAATKMASYFQGELDNDPGQGQQLEDEVKAEIEAINLKLKEAAILNELNQINNLIGG